MGFSHRVSCSHFDAQIQILGDEDALRQPRLPLDRGWRNVVALSETEPRSAPIARAPALFSSGRSHC